MDVNCVVSLVINAIVFKRQVSECLLFGPFQSILVGSLSLSLDTEPSKSGAFGVQLLTLHHGHAHQVARAPVALDEAPSSGHKDGVPGVPKAAALKAESRLVAGRFAVTLDDHAVKARVTFACNNMEETQWTS